MHRITYPILSFLIRNVKLFDRRAANKKPRFRVVQTYAVGQISVRFDIVKSQGLLTYDFSGVVQGHTLDWWGQDPAIQKTAIPEGDGLPIPQKQA